MIIRKQTARWTTKDGRKVRICDLDDKHLINIYKMLIRSHKNRWITIGPYPDFQGEMAQMVAEQEWEREIEEESETDIYDTYPIFYNIETEIKRRGISIQ